jgi:hypothetical protein
VHKIGLIIIVSFILSGCSWSTKLANDKGQLATCEAAGFGIISGAVAASKHGSCVDGYKASGYKEVTSAN